QLAISLRLVPCAACEVGNPFRSCLAFPVRTMAALAKLLIQTFCFVWRGGGRLPCLGPTGAHAKGKVSHSQSQAINNPPSTATKSPTAEQEECHLALLRGRAPRTEQDR